MSPRGERAAVAAFLGLYLLAAGAALVADSSVADEHPHILSGYLYWKSGRFAGGLENPPLGQLLVASPLVLLDRPYRFPSDEFLWLCRVPVLLSGVALGLVLWRWGRALGGPAVGLLAVAGLCIEPNLLAHAHLATLDFLLTTLWWLALWAWRAAMLAGEPAGTRRTTTALVPFAALAAGAVLVKFTGLLLFPTVALVALGSRQPALRRRGLLGVLLALAATILVAHVAYGFGPMRYGLPEQLVRAAQGKLAHRAEVRFAYLAGVRSESGFLGYYLVALGLKTPLPLLGLAAWGAWRLLRRGRTWEVALLVVPSLALVAAFTAVRVNIGVRHVLPVYPALLLLSAAGFRDLWGRRTRLLAIALLLAWVAGVMRAAPQYLPYFNMLAGGPAGGHRWLLDSNLDWGQDDLRLSRFLASPAGAGYVVDPDARHPRTGRIVVSANALYNLQRSSARPYSWLRNLPAHGFAGYSRRLYEVGRPDLERQAATRPDDPAAAWGFSAVLEEAGDVDRARRVFDAAAARIRDPAARVELAVLAARGAGARGDWQEALDWVRRGLAVRSAEPELLVLRRWFELESARAMAEPGEKGEIALELGLLRAQSGDVRAGLPALVEAAAALPDDPEAQRALAVTRARLGDFAGARELLSRPAIGARYPAELDLCAAFASADSALRRNAAVDSDLLFELARSYFENDRYDDAARALVQLLRESPDHRDALAYLCEMQVRSKMRIVEERLEPRLVWPAAPPRTAVPSG